MNFDTKHALEEELKRASLKKREKLLLHSCCGPCSCFPFLILGASYDLYVSYNNSNIYPFEEWEKRKKTLEKAIEAFFSVYGIKITLLPVHYDHDNYMKELLPLKTCKEGGERCHLCYKKRLEEARKLAKVLKIPNWCTTLTSSRQKSAQVINEIGLLLDKEDPNGPHFVLSDWKKLGGMEEGIRIASHLGLYRQNYCGCEYSLNSKKND